jgi:hypothetical protein
VNAVKYNVETKIEKDYLIMSVSGNRTLEDSLDLISAVVRICQQRGLDKVVVDIRELTDQPEVVSEFKLAKTAAIEAIGGVRKVALVCGPETHIYFSFFEKVARHQGLCLSVFLNKNEAIEWMAED